MITGTPTAQGTTTHTFTLRDSSTPAQSVQQTLNLTIAPPTAALTITTTSLPNGTVGQVYSRPVQATGGTGPFTWTISAGSLPQNLNFDPTTGVISGTPTRPRRRRTIGYASPIDYDQQPTRSAEHHDDHAPGRNARSILQPDGAGDRDRSQDLEHQRRTVTLTATPNQGSVFEEWRGGPCNKNAGTCQLTLNDNQSANARSEDD